MSTNKRERLKIENGNSIRFVAKAEAARLSITGSGTIVAEVSNDGVHYKAVDHNEQFKDGIAIFPIAMFIGDYIRISATTMTSAEINYSMVEAAERG